MKPGIYITRGWFDNDVIEFRVEATIHLKTEPALLDNFVVELKALNNGNREDAYLKAMP